MKRTKINCMKKYIMPIFVLMLVVSLPFVSAESFGNIFVKFYEKVKNFFFHEKENVKLSPSFELSQEEKIKYQEAEGEYASFGGRRIGKFIDTTKNKSLKEIEYVCVNGKTISFNLCVRYSAISNPGRAEEICNLFNKHCDIAKVPDCEYYAEECTWLIPLIY